MLQATFPVNNNFISQIDLDKPIWSQILYQPYGKISDIKEIARLMTFGERQTVGNITGVHYELDRDTTYFEAGDNFVVAGGQNIQTGELAAALVNPDGTSRVRVGDILQHSVTMKHFQVDSKSGANPPVVTLRPLETGVTDPILEGDILVYLSRSEKERSGAPGQVVRGTTAYTWMSQITRGETNISGTARNIELKPAVMQDGTPLNGYYTILTTDTEMQVMRDMFGAIYFGAQTASAQANLNISLSTTGGLNEAIRQRGWNINIGSAAISKANILTAAMNIKGQSDAQYYRVLTANKRTNEWDALFAAEQQNSMNPAVTKNFETLFFGSSDVHEVLKATYNFKAISISDITFVRDEMNTLNNPTTFYANQSADNAYQNLMFFIPYGTTSMYRDNSLAAVKSEYMTLINRSKYTDRWMYSDYRGFGTANNNGIDENIIDTLVDYSVRFVNMNAFGRII